MIESTYRASRAARLFGNPSVYTLVETLLGAGRVTPTALSRRLKRNITTVSNYLKSLKLADIVRFESDGHHNWYRVKYPEAIRRIMKAFRTFARKTSSGLSAKR